MMTGLRMCPSRKEDTEDTAWRSKRPRCSRTYVDEEGAGIRPFLEPRKTWHKQGDGSKQPPHAQDREQVHRVAKVRQDKDDGLADEEQRWPMHQVRHSTCQKLERDDCGGCPIANHF